MSFIRSGKGYFAATMLLLLAAFSAWGQADGTRPAPTAELHKARGVGCESCHGQAKEKTFVASDRCLACHGGSAATLAKKTAAVKPENPHASPHWGERMDCGVCHRQHEKTVDWCGHCHAFDFKVP